MKKISLLLTVCLIMGMLVGCGSTDTEKKVPEDGQQVSEGNKGGTLIVGMTGDPSTYNPDYQADGYLQPIAENIFNRLIKVTNKQEVVPDLAKSYKVSDDGKEITFYLNENVKWHDGAPFSSADVKFTFDTIIKEGGQLAGSLTSVEEIATPDDNTVVFKLKNKDASLIGYLAWDACYIIPKHIYEGTDWSVNPANLNPIGTGPFKFVSHDKGVSVTLERNDEYWGDKAYLDKVIFSIIPDANTAVQALYNKELDILGIEPPLSETQNFESDPDIKVGKQYWPSRYYMFFNIKDSIFKDAKLRQAVSFGIDKDDIIRKALKGVGEKSNTAMTPMYEWALNTTDVFPERDTEKAMKLIEDAGYTKKSNGMYLETTIDVFNVEPFTDIAVIIRDNLKDIGIDVKINIMEGAAWDEKIWYGRNYDISLLAGYQGPDPGALTSRFSTEAVINLMGYSNLKLDEALEKGASYVSEEDRAPYYKEAQKYIVEDVPVVPISEYISIAPYQSYIVGHPTSEEAIDKTGFHEYTYVWINK
ncbi:ABC transporter substrate-binding protein [Sedimentibacter sp.]|uniref:ABC transporter substrate-binding protein n=1 Tax=Sedimentibacter sp. TaxID=1960295 RepID=UPI00289CFB55|nr:ABC transporter substrate-binding protein [Sedimentibacter sp.]